MLAAEFFFLAGEAVDKLSGVVGKQFGDLDPACRFTGPRKSVLLLSDSPG
jgi:hypothetical protein